MDRVISQNAVPLQTFTFSSALRLLVLAPHPDDFDAIGVTMRYFQKNGILLQDASPNEEALLDIIAGIYNIAVLSDIGNNLTIKYVKNTVAD